MAWLEFRDTLASIIEGTTPTTLAGGLPASFMHFKEAPPEGGVDSRCFWIGFERMALKAPTTKLLPQRVRVPIDITIVYRDVADPTALYEAMALDYLAISIRLMDQSLWNRPDSTIESLALGSELLSEAEVDASSEDGAALIIHLMAEFTARSEQ